MVLVVVGYANQSHSLLKPGMGRWSEQGPFNSDFGRRSLKRKQTKPGNLAASGFCVISNRTDQRLLTATAIATALFDDLFHDIVWNGVEVAWLHAVAGATGGNGPDGG